MKVSKKIILFGLTVIITMIMGLWNTFWQMWLWNTQYIFNTELDKVIDTQYNWDALNSSPIEHWAFRLVNWESWNWRLSGLAWTETEITSYTTAIDKILKVIQNIVNYALWLLWVVALIYLIIHGFMILTAGGDDSKTKKWFKWIKNAFIAIAWIWLSRIIISFILRLIYTLTT